MDRPPPPEAIAAYDAFTHEHRDRRRLLADLARIAGSAAAGAALLPLIAANPAAAAMTADDDKRIMIARYRVPVAGGRELALYSARPNTDARLGTVIVIHENRGLNAHTMDIARRLALAGIPAVAPDFLTVAGGTPADEDAARAAIGALDRAATIADGAALIARLAADPSGNGKVGVIGFCWGGGMANALAVAAGDTLAAAIPYYGPAAAPADAAKIKAALLVHLAGEDERINANYPAYEAALAAAGVRHMVHRYPGTQHAFNNDTSAARYNAEAAGLAWGRTLAFMNQHLGGIA